MSRFVEENKRIAQGAVKAEKVVEENVVKGYKAVEDAVVGAYKKIEDGFVGRFLTREGESVEAAKARMSRANALAETEAKERE